MSANWFNEKVNFDVEDRWFGFAVLIGVSCAGVAGHVFCSDHDTYEMNPRGSTQPSSGTFPLPDTWVGGIRWRKITVGTKLCHKWMNLFRIEVLEWKLEDSLLIDRKQWDRLLFLAYFWEYFKVSLLRAPCACLIRRLIILMVAPSFHQPKGRGHQKKQTKQKKKKPPLSQCYPKYLRRGK